MSDLIDRKAVIKAITNAADKWDCPDDYQRGIRAGIRLGTLFSSVIPSAQPERKRGKWNCSDDMYESAVCSVCGWDTTEPWDHIRHWFNYCPNCGADMRGEQDE